LLQNLPQIFSDLCYGAVTVVFKRRRDGGGRASPGSGSAGEPWILWQGVKIYANYCHPAKLCHVVLAVNAGVGSFGRIILDNAGNSGKLVASRIGACTNASSHKALKKFAQPAPISTEREGERWRPRPG
jgi:hypothetical protein